VWSEDGERYGRQKLGDHHQGNVRIGYSFQPCDFTGVEPKLTMGIYMGASLTFPKRVSSCQTVTDSRTVSEEDLCHRGQAVQRHTTRHEWSAPYGGSYPIIIAFRCCLHDHLSELEQSNCLRRSRCSKWRGNSVTS
jgi:hypothetical protein